MTSVHSLVLYPFHSTISIYRWGYMEWIWIYWRLYGMEWKWIWIHMWIHMWISWHGSEPWLRQNKYHWLSPSLKYWLWRLQSQRQTEKCSCHWLLLLRSSRDYSSSWRLYWVKLRKSSSRVERIILAIWQITRFHYFLQSIDQRCFKPRS